MISNNVSFPIIKNIVAKVSVTLEQNILVSQMSFFLNFFFRKLQICVFIFYKCEICFQEVIFTVHFYKKTK